MQILCATQNPGKHKEFQQILGDESINLVFPEDFPEVADFDPEETGQSFQENSLIKARAFAEATGVITLADDSGLEVTSLDGQPGILSKRFALGSDHDRNQRVLTLLEDKKDRSARFVSVLCLYDPSLKEHRFFEGVVTGTIAPQEQGTAGFGYDPIFIPDGYEQTFGELGTEIKNTISHRRRAIVKLHTYLLEQTQ